MFVKQLTIFVENKFGRIADILETLGNNHVDIKALSIADTTDYGLMRMIVSDPAKAKELLVDAGVTVKITDAIAVPLDHTPGGLSKIIALLKTEGISVRYLYAFVGGKENGACVVMKTDKPEETVTVLSQNGIKPLDSAF
ncbi:MAG: acetolactate synthase [Clostridia bacterium]|jgi:hypothetical protein|nr:acetolactate synthase [Clostridia bacterium]